MHGNSSVNQPETDDGDATVVLTNPLPKARRPQFALSRLRVPIATKLIVLSTLLLLLAALAIAFMSANQFEKVSGQREELANLSQASARSNEVESMIQNYKDKIVVNAKLLIQEQAKGQAEGAADAGSESPFTLTFRRDRAMVSLEVWSLEDGVTKMLSRRVNEEYLKTYGFDQSYIARLRPKNTFIHKVFGEETLVLNSTLKGGAPLLTIATPVYRHPETGQVTHVAVADVRLSPLQAVFAKVSERLMYLVDQDGVLLAHPDEAKVVDRSNLSASPIVKMALESKVKAGQTEFTEPGKGVFIGAFDRTQHGLTVVAQASKEVILEPARNVRADAFFITGIALSLALFLVFVFSITLTAPIEKLVEVTNEVGKGNLDVKADIHTRDEVGELAEAFDQMMDGLRERDKMKNVLNKFHGSSVADDLINSDAQLGGSRKNVTVFFSDIRDFTKFSEGHSPEEVVEMLNEYFHVMVAIIHKHGGIVDKFIGDAIMAIWGAPRSTGHDEFRAAQACLEMRVALAQLNEKRLARGQTAIKIGMALHSGPAISGTIGSDQRMEYTVIGDTVNMTSRIESSTKAFGTDLLVSEATAKTIEGTFVTEMAGSAEVKGKSEPLRLFKIQGYYDENRNPVLIRTPYSEYSAVAADKVKVA